jgi:hypothetical protein
MREYRKRKHAAPMSAPAARAFSPSIMRAPEPSRLPERIIDRPVSRPALPKIGLVPQGPLSSFKTALELARSFPVGVHGSQVCPYCVNTGYSSPGTQCSYCQMGKR